MQTRFWQDSPRCRGSEQSILECSTMLTATSARCFGEDIQVACRNFPIPEAGEGEETTGAGANLCPAHAVFYMHCVTCSVLLENGRGPGKEPGTTADTSRHGNAQSARTHTHAQTRLRPSAEL